MSIFKEEISINRVIVHGGPFHLDDVLCVALIKNQFPNVEIVRENNPDLSNTGPETGIVIADVGRQYDPEKWIFDHHQDRYAAGATDARAAVGRLWDALGNAEDFPSLTSIIRAVDAHDTGANLNQMGKMVRAFEPNWDEPQEWDKCFHEALNWVMMWLERQIARDVSTKRAIDNMGNFPVVGHVMVMDYFVPWHEYVKTHEDVSAVVFPGRDDQWNISGVVLPEEWVDNPPEGVVFVPAWRTMAACCSKERAVELARYLVSRKEEEVA